jgi:UPF0755 protein
LARGNRSRQTYERTAEERERARDERARRRADRSAGTEPNGQPGAEPNGLPGAEPVAEQHAPEPPLGSPVPEQPPAEEPPAEQPPAEETSPEELAAEQPLAEETSPEELAAEQPLAEETSPEELAAGQPLAEEPPAEQPTAEHGVAEGDLGIVPAGAFDDPAPAASSTTPAPIPDAPVPHDPPAAPSLPAVPEPSSEQVAPAQADADPAPAGRPSFAGARAAAPLFGRASIPARGRSRRRRSPIARGAAVAALAAAIAAVVLLVRALLDSQHTKTVAPPAVVRVLLPEGETRIQIAKLAAADGLVGSYRAAAKRSALLNPAHYGAPRGTPDLEGFLFPATYEMVPHAPVSRLVNEQLAAFKENFGAAEIKRAHALHVTPYQLLTVASMIEREAQVPSDRAKVAAVIYNRLRQGMPLGIDATILYAIEMREGVATYTKELTEAQLHIDSPYNTRTRTGLPPTPISNPGLASIHAAANPAHDSYLYYVAGADGCGEQLFSRTLAEFETHAAAYQAAVRRNGGRPPTCKKK